MGALAPPNPAPLAAAGVRGTKDQRHKVANNEKQNTNEPAELQLMECLTSGVMAIWCQERGDSDPEDTGLPSS